MNDPVAKSGRMATTRAEYAAQIRNAGIREALGVLQWPKLLYPTAVRVEMATRILMDSCERQARVLP